MSHVSPAFSPAAATASPPALTGEVATTAPASGRHSFTFHDFLNIFNPLQHIPIVSTIYRELTGDTMKPISSILGGALFGGMVGLASSAVDAIVQETTGEDIGAHIMATLGLHHDKNAPTETAQATPNTTGPAAQTVSVGADQALQAIAAKYGSTNSGQTRAVPAFLVAEAAADRASHDGAIGPAGSAAKQSIEDQPSDLWRSLQRGGNGTTRPAKATPLMVPPGVLSDGKTGGARAATVLAATAAASAAPPVVMASGARPTASAVPPGQAADVSTAPGAAAQPAPFQVGPNGVQPLPRQAIPEMMMQALAKYEAMNKAPQASSVDQVH